MKLLNVFAAVMLLGTIGLSAAQSGEEIYKAKCSTCHMQKPMMDKAKMMQMSKEERMSMRDKMMKDMKAPPLGKVSAKLKHDFAGDKAKFTAFVKEYIKNPSADKSRCMPMAVKRFGVMPAIGADMSDADLDTIANWLYDNFDQKWDAAAMKGMQGKKGMMCGSGKCGQGMGNGKKKMKAQGIGQGMKCASGKCGGAK